ncbi:MAG: hypothetical protein OEV42_21055 [Deltaproteobacteria bacterium]|nr:hypothetical protein [Deltaproteobacteria bacterium]
MKTKLSLFVFLTVVCLSHDSIGYEKTVHRQITKNSIDISDLSTSLGQLDMSIQDRYLNKSVRKWVEDGSAFEDGEYEGGPKFWEDLISATVEGARYKNHFYDPTTGSGLNDTVLGYTMTGLPSLQWGKSFGESGNEFSWSQARFYFMGSLTYTNAEDREEYFAKTFRALGQIMHLVQDKSVPAHVRNDMHGFSLAGTDMYEKYLKEEYALRLDGYPAVDNEVFNTLDSFWDTNTGKGLAEFTNTNFISRDSNFGDNKYDNYNNPVAVGINLVEESVKPEGIGVPVTVNVKYLHGYVADRYRPDQSKIIKRLSAFSYFDFELKKRGYKEVYSLNNKVHEESADFLLPRAVGYSAGLLNYFFRGEMGVQIDSNGLTVTNNSKEVMTYITNSRGNEFGEINIYYDNNSGFRIHLATYQLLTPLAPGESTPVISFDPPDDNVKRGRYIVVFNGKLGQEEGAVIGLVTEPPKAYYLSRRNGIEKIYSMNQDGSGDSVVYADADPSIKIGKIALSPDRKSLAFSTSDGPSIFLLDIENRLLQRLTYGDWPTWSPDGTKIAFQRETGDYLPTADVELFLIDVQTKTETKLTDVPGSSYSAMPAWSPDGNTIAYVGFQPEGCYNLHAILLMDSSGNPIGPVTCQVTDGNIPMDAAPAWSPDGKEIAFTRRLYRGSTPSYYELYKLSLSGQQVKKMTLSDGLNYAEFTPSWSSDGKHIAVGSNKDGDFDIWLIDSAGTDGFTDSYKENLTNSNPDIDGYPVFSW